MPVPYAQILLSVNGDTYAAGARASVPSLATIAMKGESIAQWEQARWEIFGFPPNNDHTAWSGPGTGDWAYDATKGAWVSSQITPAPFNVPNSSLCWGKWLLRLIVNNGYDPTTGKGLQYDPAGNLLPSQVVDILGGWQVLSPLAGLRDVSPQEGEQFSALSYVRELQFTLRTIDMLIGGGGGAVAMGGDVTGPSSASTVGKWRNVALDSSMATPSNGQIAQYDSGSTSWKAVALAAAVVLAGDVNGAYNANHVDHLTGVAGVVDVVATALKANSANSSLTIGTNKAGATLAFQAGIASTVLTLDPSGVHLGAGLLLFDPSIATPNFGQGASTTTANGQTLYITPQAPKVGGGGVAGNVLINVPVSDGAGVKNGGFLVNYAGNPLALVGTWGGSTSIAALWLGGPSTATPNANNFAFLSDGSTYTIFNTPGGALYFRVGNSDLFNVSGSTIFFDGVNTLQWGVGLNALITQSTATLNVAPTPITITTQVPNAGSSITYGMPANVIVDSPAGVAGAALNGGVLHSYATTPTVRFGAYNGAAVYGAIWFVDAGAPNTSNFGFLGNQSITYLNAAVSAGQIALSFGGSSAQALNGLFGGGGMSWYSGSSVSAALYFGTGVDGAVLNLAGGNERVMLSLLASSASAGTATLGLSAGTNQLVGALVCTTRTKSSSFTLDDTTTDKTVYVTGTLTCTLSAGGHTNGREVEFILDTTSTGSNGSDVTLTLAPAGSEKINGTNGNWAITLLGSPKGVLRVKLFGNGTDVRVVS